MAVLEDTFTESLTAIRSAACALPTAATAVRAVDDDRLLDAQRILAEARRALDASASVIAGEIAHRSRRELGYDGLAQRLGFRTAESLLQHTAGSTTRDASTLVAVGTLVHEANSVLCSDVQIDDLPDPWLLAVGSAVVSGSLSVDAAGAIRTGLGVPSALVTSELLTVAVQALLAEAPALHADELLTRARRLRDDLDGDGVARREQQLRDERSIRRVRRANGLSRYIVDPDLEAAAFWDDLYDRVTAPRRGNVSFLGAEDRAWADAASGGARGDGRTVDQYVHDTFTDLLRLACDGDTPAGRRIVGSRSPSVRVLVTARALETGVGAGHLEGIASPVSLATVERLACAHGAVAISFDSAGNALDVGREQRLYTARQRVALAARDGGCRFHGCDRPPSWCEAHHIDHWHRDHGQTDLERGVLLCRHHHMLVHNNGWEIAHDEAGYWLIPPASVDPEQTPRPMPSKSAALRDLYASRLA
ncbi:HNH endonuclease signature motif containing protein [Lacisediminihabitans profunda]|nr:HNH endonuclease signature motif containing protein [Lacisediminihabitans profunda]